MGTSDKPWENGTKTINLLESKTSWNPSIFFSVMHIFYKLLKTYLPHVLKRYLLFILNADFTKEPMSYLHLPVSLLHAVGWFEAVVQLKTSYTQDPKAREGPDAWAVPSWASVIRAHLMNRASSAGCPVLLGYLHWEAVAFGQDSDPT